VHILCIKMFYCHFLLISCAQYSLFYWVESLQSYNVGGWNYIDELHKFVDNGISDGNKFIDAVSGIVNRGCHNPPCASGGVDGAHERAQNFDKVLKVFDLIS